MPINIQANNLPPATGRISANMGSFTTSFVGSSSAQPDVDGAIDRSMGEFVARFGEPGWPANSWFMTGGYQISNAATQLTTEPWLTYNAEKDILIPQCLAPDKAILDSYTGYYKNVKDYNPNCKVVPYASPAVARKVEYYANGTGWPDFNYRLVNGSDGTTQWYLKNAAGEQVQAKFSFQFTRVNWAVQFLNDNTSGENLAEAFFRTWFEQASATGSNGRFIDYMDGVYLDVVPPAPQAVYDYASSPRTSTNQDFDNDGSADGTADETDGSGVEANYGGCRMYRRGAAQWVTAFKNTFGPSYTIFRNGTRDGLDYTSGELKTSTHPMTDSEFYQAWDGGMYENMEGGIGIDKNNSTLEYDINYNQFGVVCKWIARQKACHQPEGSHPWGRFGAHVLHTQFNILDPSLLPGGVWRQKDYNMARFMLGLFRLNGTCCALNVSNLYSFPTMDEDVFPCGDTIDGNPPTMGTYDPSTAVAGVDADYTLRSPDYESGAADFYWQQYYTADGTEKYIWVVRSDFSGGNTHGYGSEVACQLPDPGASKKWVHIDVTSTVTNGVRQTRAQDTALNDGSDVDAGGTYGSVSLLPAHAVMLVSTDA